MYIKLFAYLKEELGSEVSVELPEKINQNIVLEALKTNFSNQKELFLDCSVAVNTTILGDEELALTAVKEIAVFPPVSGG